MKNTGCGIAMLDDMEKPGMTSSSCADEPLNIDIGAQLQQEIEDVVNLAGGSFNTEDDQLFSFAKK